MSSSEKIKKILLVDNEPDGIDWILKNHGYEIELARDGKDALTKLYSDNKFDLAIIDLVMPNMTGLKLLEKVRKNEKTKILPVIILTGINTNQHHIFSLKIGADDYIPKPYDISTLLARIESLLRRVDWYKEATDNLNTEPNNGNGNNQNNKLTKRQSEILSLMSQGYSNKQVADTLYLSETTIKAHLRTIFKKLKVANRTQAVLTGLKDGLITEP